VVEGRVGMSLLYYDRELRRAAKRLKVEIVQLSYEGHCRCEHVDFWPTTQKFWNRSTGQRGAYRDLRTMLEEQLQEKKVEMTV
jgi:hypothetical protein